MDYIEELVSDIHNDVEIVVTGRCTMHGSPGRFVKLKNLGGTHTFAMGEGHTVREAFDVAKAKLRPLRRMPLM